MPALVLDVLKYVFLAILYIFMARAVRAVYSELRPDRREREAAPSRSSAPRGKGLPRKATVVEGDQMRGKSFGLEEELTIGRSDKCRVILDDSYVSQLHARIFMKNGTCMVEDLGSTNGTYVNQRRISSPVQLQRGDRVKIGKTVLEMKR